MTLKKTTWALATMLGAGLILQAAPLDEAGFQKLMKEVGGATKRFKPAVDGQDGAQLAKDAARVGQIYKEMAAFWKTRKSDKAVKWSEDSSSSALLAADAAKKGDWEKVKQSLQGVTKNCKACHDEHREKLEDGSYKIK
jgi:cytochrome c556